MLILSELSERMLKALDVSLKGLLSIFIAMAILYVVIVILNKVTNKEKKKKINN